MIWLKHICAFLVLIAIVNADELQSPGIRAVLRVYDECLKTDSGFSPCLKKKAITFMDRLTKVSTVNVADGVKVIQSEGGSVGTVRALTETELEETLPRGLEARDDALTNMLIDRVATFFSSRTLQVSLPKVSSEELGRGLEEG